MKIGRLLSYVRRAVQDFDMIEDNDNIAVGVSGGKDSLCLLVALKNLQRFYPKKFSLSAISVSLGFKDMDFSPVNELCKQLEVPYYIVETDIAEIVFDERKEKNPCSLCSKMRKGALNEKVVEIGCNKIALGHNRDDTIETFFLSLFYEGRIHTFSPKMYMDRKNIHTIRPLVYVPEREIKGFCNQNGIITVKNSCPVDGDSKRAEIDKFIEEMSKEYDSFEQKIFNAIQNGNLAGWQQ